jgi:glutathione S-transferase
MFCYGEKEAWYTKKVPSGMLPAVELDGPLRIRP